MKFEMGRLYITVGIQMYRKDNELKWIETLETCIERHLSGDWGDLCEEDKHYNDLAVIDGGRILSAYKTELFGKIYIITEASREYTTILLPEEY